MKEDKKYDFKALFRLLSFARGSRTQMYTGIGLSLVLSALQSARPYLTKIAVDDYVLQGKAKGFLLFILIMVGLLFAQAVFQYFFTYLANWIGQQIIRDMRVKLLERIVYFRLKYFDQTPLGVLVTRSVNDIETIAMIFSDGILVIFGDVLNLIVVASVMLHMNWRLSLIVFALLPLLLWIVRWFQRAIKKSYQEVRTQVARLNTFAQERLSGMRIVQVFNREEAEYEKFKTINKCHRDAQIQTVLYFSFFFPIIDLLSAIALGCVIWYGGLQAVLNQTVSVGDMIAFITFIQLLFRPMRQIADKFNSMQSGLVSANRVWHIIDLDQAMPNRGTHTATQVAGAIHFRDVHFSYTEGEAVLKGISFDIKAGENAAIVGATGAGKSTIINLLSRFYHIQKGEISMDGVLLEEWDVKNLRAQIAFVPQDVFLFSDSIYNNIVLELDIPMEEVIEAAREIGVHDFIMSLPGGYDYNVRERGMTLSVGQRQLLSFLRAYVADKPILILDEATSSVDPHTEKLIQNATDKLTQGRTSILIAHRLTTVQNADKIIVMEAGKIQEIGTHDALLRKGEGVYHRLFKAQFAV